jgi:hypothetical protein
VTGAHQAVQRFARARESVERAASAWNATDVSACEQASALLAAALQDMQAANEAVHQTTTAGRRDILAVAEELRGTLTRLGRLIDSSSSFCRGMAQRTGVADAVLGNTEVSTHRGELGQA